MAAKERHKKGRIASWVGDVKDTAQALLTIITIAGVPVGAYVYLLNAISATRYESREQFTSLERKIDVISAEFRAEMKVLAQRQNTVEDQTRDLRQEIGVERSERNRYNRTAPVRR